MKEFNPKQHRIETESALEVVDMVKRKRTPR